MPDMPPPAAAAIAFAAPAPATATFGEAAEAGAGGGGGGGGAAIFGAAKMPIVIPSKSARRRRLKLAAPVRGRHRPGRHQRLVRGRRVAAASAEIVAVHRQVFRRNRQPAQLSPSGMGIAHPRMISNREWHTGCTPPGSGCRRGHPALRRAAARPAGQKSAPQRRRGPD